MREPSCRRRHPRETSRIGQGSRRTVDIELVIEGGVAGGSARQQAAQRRATADRLLIEASWLDGIAADESSMAARLAELPPAYAILHDLRLPGSKGNIDHLIVGPGGAFVVLTRRCADAVEYHDGQLWSGGQPLRDVLAAARVESQLLTQTMGTPVVPVLALLDTVLPTAAPPSVDGVLVCSGDVVVRAITRGSHTQLPPHKVTDAAERVLPLLHDPASAPRTESALGVRADPVADPSVNPVVPPPRPPSAESVQRRRATERAARKAKPTGERPAAKTPAKEKAAKEKSGRARSVRFIVVALAALCVAAVVVGTVIGMLWSDDDSGSTGAPVTTSTAPAAGGSSTSASAAPLAAAVAAPVAAFDAACPVEGAGWELQPLWPGDATGLARYDVEIQSLDGSWSNLPPIESAAAPWDGLDGQAPGATYTVRITAVMTDGSRSAGEATVIAAPATGC